MEERLGFSRVSACRKQVEDVARVPHGPLVETSLRHREVAEPRLNPVPPRSTSRVGCFSSAEPPLYPGKLTGFQRISMGF